MKKPGQFILSLIIAFVAFHFIAVHGRISDTNDWVSIDCGSGDDDFVIDDNAVIWDTDDLYTNVGINKRVQIDQPLQLMETLRAFPSSNGQSCYSLPIDNQKLRYLVRSGFLYGDYDSLNRPPTFDIRIDGKKMSTITISSISEVVNDEIVHTSGESGYMSFCLEKTKNGGDPFVSSLQAVPVENDLYSKMELDQSFGLVARISYGQDDDGFDDLGDDYERLWTFGSTPPNCNNVNTQSDSNSPENDPPSSVITNAVESKNASSPIILTVDFPQRIPQSHSAYFTFYFSETNLDTNRTMDILINGQKMSTVTTNVTGSTVITLYPVVVTSTTINVTLTAVNSTGLPPLINAMEVFSELSKTTSGGMQMLPSIRFVSFILILSLCVVAVLML